MVHFNESLKAINTTGCYCIKIVKVVVSYIIFYYMLEMSASSSYQYLRIANGKQRRIKNEWADPNHVVMYRAVGDVAPVSIRALAFVLEADISNR